MGSKEEILAWLKMGNSEFVGLGDLLVVVLQTLIFMQKIGRIRKLMYVLTKLSSASTINGINWCYVAFTLWRDLDLTFPKF